MKNILILIIIILVLLFIMIGVIGYQLLIKPQLDMGSNGLNQKAPDKPCFLIDPEKIFVTNLKDSDMHLKTDLRIEVQNKEAVAVLKENTYKVHDIINGILRKITEDDMDRTDICDVLKNEIKNRLQHELKINNIIDVYFIEFVAQ